MQVGFSTATRIREVDGTDYGNLERFKLLLDGKQVAPVDRNVWGVTFADDDRPSTRPWRPAGRLPGPGRPGRPHPDRDPRRVAECPALSPDGSKVAYKIERRPGRPDPLDRRRPRPGHRQGGPARPTRPRSVDDQVQWLDDDTLLYGLPRDDETGVTDVWPVDTYPDAKPSLLIEDAWSPAVISTSASSGGER